MNYFAFYVHDLRLAQSVRQTEQKAMPSASLISWVMSKAVDTPPGGMLARDPNVPGRR